MAVTDILSYVLMGIFVLACGTVGVIAAFMEKPDDD